MPSETTALGGALGSTISSDELETNSIIASKIQTGAIASDEIATDAIIASKIQNATITQTKMASGVGVGVVAATLVERTAGDITTTSTAYVDLTSATISITTGANRVLLLFSGSSANSAVNNHNVFRFVEDNAAIAGAGTARFAAKSGSERSMATMFYTKTVTAAAHSWTVQWNVDAGTGTVDANTTTQFTFAVIELAD